MMVGGFSLSFTANIPWVGMVGIVLPELMGLPPTRPLFLPPTVKVKPLHLWVSGISNRPDKPHKVLGSPADLSSPQDMVPGGHGRPRSHQVDRSQWRLLQPSCRSKPAQWPDHRDLTGGDLHRPFGELANLIIGRIADYGYTIVKWHVQLSFNRKISFLKNPFRFLQPSMCARRRRLAMVMQSAKVVQPQPYSTHSVESAHNRGPKGQQHQLGLDHGLAIQAF